MTARFAGVRHRREQDFIDGKTHGACGGPCRGAGAGEGRDSWAGCGCGIEPEGPWAYLLETYVNGVLGHSDGLLLVNNTNSQLYTGAGGRRWYTFQTAELVPGVTVSFKLVQEDEEKAAHGEEEDIPLGTSNTVVVK